MKPEELLDVQYPFCSTKCEIVEFLGAGECSSICYSKFDQTICCDCLKCYNGCKNAFPESYINGGAIHCKDFERDNDSMNILRKMKIKEKELMDMYAKRGIFI
jgi:hypothetical protein